MLPFLCLPVAVIVELVVGGQRDQAPPRSRQREKDLSGCVFPHLTEEDSLKTKKMDVSRRAWRTFGHLCIIQLLPLGCDKVQNAVKGSRQGHASDQQNDQNNVGKGGCEVDHLSRDTTRWTERV